MSSWMNMLNDMDETDAQAGDFQPLPDGWYEAITSGSTEKENKSGQGHHINVTYTIVGENYAGRKVFGNFNVDNPKPTAQQIGLGELKRMMLAGGLEKISDVSDLDDLTLWIKVGRDKKDAEKNVIKAFRSTAPDAEPAKPIAKAAAKPEPAASSVPARKPWSKK